MTDETLCEMIKSGIEYADEIVSFAFQGGEPTVAGLNFYKETVEYKKYLQESGKKNLQIHNAIQINWYIIGENWAELFHKNNFLLWFSLDYRYECP